MEVICVAASDVDGGALMAVGGLNSGGELDPHGNVPVTVKRLDNVIAEPVDVIKMDIEGCEMHAVCGMPQILSRRPVVFSEFYPRLLCKQGIEPQKYIEYWFSHDYEVFDLDVNTQEKVRIRDANAIMERFLAKREDVCPQSRRLVYLDLMLVPMK